MIKRNMMVITHLHTVTFYHLNLLKVCWNWWTNFYECIHVFTLKKIHRAVLFDLTELFCLYNKIITLFWLGCKHNYYYTKALSKDRFKNAFLNVGGSDAITQNLKFTTSLNMMTTFPYITITCVLPIRTLQLQSQDLTHTQQWQGWAGADRTE